MAGRPAAWVRVALLVCFAGAPAGCDRSTPVSPSSPPGGPISISGLEATELGIEAELCGGSAFYTAVDELTFIVKTGNPASLVGATVNQQADGQAEAAIGTIAECAAVTSPCGADSFCVIDPTPAAVKVRAHTRVPWTPEHAWNISLTRTGYHSNTLRSVITRPDTLPWSDQAAIVSFIVTRANHSDTAWDLVVYSPGVDGRTITVIFEGYSGSKLAFSRLNDPIAEVPGRRQEVVHGGMVAPVSALFVIGIIEERDSSGGLLVRATMPLSGS